MKPEGTLIAERPLAEHSEKLVRRAPDSGELAAALAARSASLERALSEALQHMLGTSTVEVACAGVEKAAAPKLHKIIDPVACNGLLRDSGGARLVLSLSHAALLSMTDQVFGGSGAAAAQRPSRLPASANLAWRRFAAALGPALATAFECPEPLSLAARSEVLGKFVSARDPDTHFLLRCEVTQDDRQGWGFLLVIRQDDAARLVNAQSAVLVGGQGDRRRPDAAPFASLPMPLVAMLGQVAMPVSRIAALKPGDVLPLAIPSHVQLRLADTEIARGRIGTLDGALALQLTRIAWDMKGPEDDG